MCHSLATHTNLHLSRHHHILQPAISPRMTTRSLRSSKLHQIPNHPRTTAKTLIKASSKRLHQFQSVTSHRRPRVRNKKRPRQQQQRRLHRHRALLQVRQFPAYQPCLTPERMASHRLERVVEVHQVVRPGLASTYRATSSGLKQVAMSKPFETWTRRRSSSTSRAGFE